MTGPLRILTFGNALAALAIVTGVALVVFRSQHLDETSAGADRAPLVLLELQTKLLAGMARFDRIRALSEIEQLKGFESSPAGRRAVAALQAYLLSSPDRPAALRQLPLPDAREPLDTLAARAISEPSTLTPGDRATLLTEMGWFGRLLLASSDAEIDRQVESSSLKAMAIAGLASFLIFFAFLTGIVLLFFALIRRQQGLLPFRLEPSPERSHLYFQAFAIYLWGMILFSTLALLLVGKDSPLNLISSACSIVLSAALGIAYPRFRGVGIAEWRSDLGLHRGRGFFREVAAGIAAYLALLPLLAIGLGLTLVLQKLGTASGETPSPISHPLYGLMPDASPGKLALLFLVAAVVGPFIEEMMFRGALYGALRSFAGRGLSLLLMSFIFAALHPQGVFAIPGLMAIAMSFGMMREWRSSLVAGAVMHGLHNGALLLGILLLLS